MFFIRTYWYYIARFFKRNNTRELKDCRVLEYGTEQQVSG